MGRRTLRRGRLPRRVLDAFNWMTPRAEDRERLLEALERGAARADLDFEAVYRALCAAWFQAEFIRRDRRSLTENRRWLKDRTKLRADVAELTARFEQLYRTAFDPKRSHPVAFPLRKVTGAPGLPAQVAGVDGVLSALDALLAAVNADPVLQTPLRRSRGHEGEPWLTPAINALRAAGLTKESAEEILNIIGLKTARS